MSLEVCRLPKHSILGCCADYLQIFSTVIQYNSNTHSEFQEFNKNILDVIFKNKFEDDSCGNL